MTFEVELDGKRRTVSIEPSGAGSFRVTVDGRLHVVRAERTGEFGLSIIADEAGRSIDMTVTPAGSQGEVLIRWAATRRLGVNLVYSHFFAGPFLQRASLDRDVDFFAMWFSYRF